MLVGSNRGALLRVVVAVAAVWALLPAAASGAGRGIDIGFAEPEFGSRDATIRGLALDRASATGARYARIGVGWRGVAPDRPADPSDPSDPLYRFGELDAAVTDAAARGMDVVLTLHSAPGWANESALAGRGYPGTPETRHPDAAELGHFARALALRYSGFFVPGGPSAPPVPLPQVRFYEPWNEPNLTGFLSPQWVDGIPYSPHLYRGLLNAAYDGIKSVQPDATVIAGSTGPNGSERGGRRLAPLRFLRQLLCVRDRRRLEPVPCPEPARFDVLSHHPITPLDPPHEPTAGADDIGVSEMGKLRRVLRAAERLGTVGPAGLTRPLWATEFWWESSPPTTLYEAPSQRRQAQHIADALRLLWRQRVPVAFLFQVRDDRVAGGPPRSGWGSGVFRPDGTPKAAFRAVRLPLVADRVSRRRVRIWARAPEAGSLVVRAVRRRGERVLVQRDVAAGEVLTIRRRLRGRARLTARLGDGRSISRRVPARRVTR